MYDALVYDALVSPISGTFINRDEYGYQRRGHYYQKNCAFVMIYQYVY